jgi:hypothetical protein
VSTVKNRKDEWKATGLILVNGKAVAWTVDSPLLVLDIDAWSRTAISTFEDCASKCRSEGDEDGYGEFITMVQELEAWLSKGEISQSVFPMALRQSIDPREVNLTNLKHYLWKVMSFGRMAHVFEDFEFFFDADAEVPTLYATERLKAQVRHTGNCVDGQTVSRDDLDNLIAEAMLRVQGALTGLPAKKVSLGSLSLQLT